MARKKKYSGDLWNEVGKRTGIGREEARRILSNAEDVIQEWVADDHIVILQGFGTFDRAKVEFRPGAEFRRHMDGQVSQGPRRIT